MLNRVLLICTVLAILAIPSAAAQLPEVKSLEGDPVVTVLPPDAIRAIDAPKFVPAKDAKFMQAGEPVLGVVHRGVAKAYSLWHLDRHEVVNDTLGGTPVGVTW